ncbi:uncharacterized protein LOC124156187 [Ischnura elegans]|uniref:uncharacterized protein LOC124156187 n=1 Tax=Ischnura elegans TaxID=197161 RepID=UPI001ED87EAB|nr:uncharacterized protein LOC124156187 [Ischnura elegans]
MRHSNRHLPNLVLLLALYVLCGPTASECNEDDLRKACATIFHEPEINGAALRFNFSFGGNLRPRRQFEPGSEDGANKWPPGVPPDLLQGLTPGGVAPTPGGAGVPPPFSCFLVFAVGPAKARVRGSRILVQVSDLRIPPGSKCNGAGDAVRVYSVLRGRLFLVREFCENDNYYPAIITESHMAVVTITFPEVPSDRRVRGFNLKVEAYTDIFEEVARRNLSDKLIGPASNLTEMYGTINKPEDKEHEWNVLSQQSWGNQGFHPYLPGRHPLSEPHVGTHGHGRPHGTNMYPSTSVHQSFHGQSNAISNGDFQPPPHGGLGIGQYLNHNYPILRPPKIQEDPFWNTFEEHHSTHGHGSTNTWSPIHEQGVHSGNVQLPSGTWYPEDHHSTPGNKPTNTWSPIHEQGVHSGNLQLPTGTRYPEKHHSTHGNKPINTWSPIHEQGAHSGNVQLPSGTWYPEDHHSTPGNKPTNSWSPIHEQGVHSGNVQLPSGTRYPEKLHSTHGYGPTNTWSPIHEQGVHSGNLQLPSGTRYPEKHHSTHGNKPINTWSPIHEQGAHSGNVQLPSGTWYPEDHHSTPGNKPTNTWSPIHGQGVHSGNVQLPSGTWYPELDHSAQISHGALPPSVTWSPIQEHGNLNTYRPTEGQHSSLENSWNGITDNKPTWGYVPETGSINSKPQKYSEWSTFNTHVPGRPSDSYLPPHTSHHSSSHEHWNRPLPQKITQNKPTGRWNTMPSNENHEFTHNGHRSKPDTNKYHQWNAVDEPVSTRPKEQDFPSNTWTPVFHHGNNVNSYHPENFAKVTEEGSLHSNPNPQVNTKPPTPWRNSQDWSKAEKENGNYWTEFIP